MSHAENMQLVGRGLDLVNELDRISIDEVKEKYKEWLANTNILAEYFKDGMNGTHINGKEMSDISLSLLYLSLPHIGEDENTINMHKERVQKFVNIAEDTLFYTKYFTDTFIRPMSELMHNACIAATEYKHGVIDCYGKDIITDAERRDAHE